MSAQHTDCDGRSWTMCLLLRNRCRDVDAAAHLLEEQLARLQAGGELRSDFDPGAMAVAIRATIDVVPHRLILDPDFDIDNYSREIITVFDLATRAKDTP